MNFAPTIVEDAESCGVELSFQLWIIELNASESDLLRLFDDWLSLTEEENIQIPTISCSELLTGQQKSAVLAIPNKYAESPKCL